MMQFHSQRLTFLLLALSLRVVRKKHSLKSNPDELRKLVENHVCDDKQTMKDVKSMITMKSRAASARLVVHKQQESMTVNGQRIVQMNQKGPMAGVVHVLDGLLYPLADKNIMKV